MGVSTTKSTLASTTRQIQASTTKTTLDNITRRTPANTRKLMRDNTWKSTQASMRQWVSTMLRRKQKATMSIGKPATTSLERLERSTSTMDKLLRGFATQQWREW